MFLLALLSTDADACAMAYGGGSGFGTVATVNIGSYGLGDLMAEIDQPESQLDRFEKLAPKLQGQAPEEAPTERTQAVRPVS